jgi:hypothetical protein
VRPPAPAPLYGHRRKRIGHRRKRMKESHLQRATSKATEKWLLQIWRDEGPPSSCDGPTRHPAVAPSGSCPSATTMLRPLHAAFAAGILPLRDDYAPTPSSTPRAGPDIFVARFGTKMEANNGDQHSADRPISRLRGGRRRPSASVSRVTIRAPGRDAKKSRRAVRWTGGRRSLIDWYFSLFLYNRSAICYL